MFSPANAGTEKTSTGKTSTGKIPTGTPEGRRMIGFTLFLSLFSFVMLALTLAGSAQFLAGALSGIAPAWPAEIPLLTGIAAGASLAARHWLGGAMSLREESALRSRLMQHALRQGAMLASPIPAPDQLDNISPSTGKLVAMMGDGAERVAFYRQTFIGPMIGSLAVPALLLTLMAVLIDPVSAGIIAACLPLIPLFIGGFLKVFRLSGANSRQARDTLAAQYLDAIQGLTTLRLHRAARRMETHLAAVGEKNRRAVMRLLAANQVVLLVMDLAFFLFVVVASTITAYLRLEAGQISPAAALTVVLWAILLLEPLDQVAMFFYVAVGGLGAQRGIRAFLADEAAPASPALPLGSTAALHRTSGPAVELRDVSFAYPGGPALLHRINLTVQAGEKVAIVGPSGAGKSTLISLLKGDLQPTAGQISVNGTKYTAASADQLRAQSALVAQSTWLFAGTLAENLHIAHPGATETQMWQALERANLAGEIKAKASGLQTDVGERGLALSGGQAQRLALARAFLSGRALLLLDEPTSQVDLASEAAIIAALSATGPEETVIMVTHRASALTGATRVLEVSAGQLRQLEVNHDN